MVCIDCANDLPGSKTMSSLSLRYYGETGGLIS
jgi:hypothetical protein